MQIQLPAVDSADFTELLLKHLVRSAKVHAEAKKLNVVGEDFASSADYGVQVYRVIGDIVMGVAEAPLSPELFGLHLRQALEDGRIHEVLVDQLAELYHWLYSGPLDETYFATALKDYVKRRRMSKTITEHSGDADRLMVEMAKIHHDFEAVATTAEVQAINPFETLVKKSVYQMVPTGIHTLDTALGGGIGYSEYALLVGFSGGGKTALSSFMAGNAAMNGFKVAFLSFEESIADMSNRFYSRFFKLDYTELHNGSAGQALSEKFAELYDTPEMQKLKENLRVFNLKEFAPMTPDAILALLTAEFEKNGFCPDVVFLDQFQFVEPLEKPDDGSAWKIDEFTSKELDAMSHKRIGGKPFALWVNHQAKGKLKKTFTREDIHGFKGIIQKADTVVGIGREGEMSIEFCVFSLKSRHSKPFELPLDGQLEFMTFVAPVRTAQAPPMQTGYNFGNSATEKVQVSETDQALVMAARNGVASRPGMSPINRNNGDAGTKEKEGST